MSKRSPGNWSVVDRMSCGEGWAVISDHDFPGRPPTVHKRYMAQIIGTIDDAHLISAAPDMFQVLQQLILADDNLSGQKRDDAMDDVLNAARAAIAKAKGETG